MTGNGIDFHALKAGRDIEFELDPLTGEDNYNWEDEDDNVIDYEKIFKYRNMDMVNCGDGDDDPNDCNENKEKSANTPFEILRSKMSCITPEYENGVVKRILENGSGLVVPNGSRVRGESLGYNRNHQ